MRDWRSGMTIDIGVVGGRKRCKVGIWQVRRRMSRVEGEERQMSRSSSYGRVSSGMAR